MNQEFISFGIGRLTKAPLFTKGQKADGKDDRAWFVVATNRPKNADGTTPDPKYTPVVCWGVTARNAAEYLAKGQVVAVLGRLNTRANKREDGTFDHYAEVVADRLIYGPKAKNTPAPAQTAQAPAAQAANPLAGLDPAAIMQLSSMLMAAQGQAQAAQAPAATEGGTDNPFEG